MVSKISSIATTTIQAFRCLEVLGVSGFDWMFMRAIGTMQKSPKTLGMSADMMARISKNVVPFEEVLMR